MPASELLALADRWRQDPTGAAQDGQLLATTRAALASLDGTERAAIARELRGHGQQELAQRLEVSDRLPVWSEDFTSVARELLTVDATTLADLRDAVDPDLLSELGPPSGDPIADLPPPPDVADDDAADAWDAEVPSPDEDAPAEDAPVEDAPVQLSDAELRELRSGARSEYDPGASSAWRYTPMSERLQRADDATTTAAARAPQIGDVGAEDGEEPWPADEGDPAAAWDTEGTWDAGAASDTEAARAQLRAAAAGRHAEPTFAPGTRSTTTARERFDQLDELADATPAALAEHLRDVPDGWQRRRLILRLVARDVTLPTPDVLLSELGRAADRTTVADRLIRHGRATLDQVEPHLTAGAYARLAARHR